MCARKYFMFFVVLVLVSVQVFAWPTKTEKAVVTEASPVVAEENSVSPSSEMQKTVSTDYSEILTKLDSQKVVLGSDLQTLKDDVGSMASALTILIADNRALNDSLAEVTGKYEKANGTKFFADLGAAFGFKSEKIQYGFVGDMGLRFGKGLLVKTGVQYMLGDVGKIEMPTWDIGALTVSATVGWEW